MVNIKKNIRKMKKQLKRGKRVKIPKGLTLKELRDSLKAIGRKSVFKVDYSDKKEEDV